MKLILFSFQAYEICSWDLEPVNNRLELFFGNCLLSLGVMKEF